MWGAIVWTIAPKFLLCRHRAPGPVRIEAIDCLRELESFGSEVPLVDHAVVAHHERLHSSDAILCWKRDHREAADHRAIHNVIHLSERSSRPLAFQHFEKVTVVRLLFASGVTALNSTRYVF